MKRTLWILSTVVAIVAIGVLAASWPVEGSYRSRAQLVQRVEIDKGAADLFDDPSAGQREIGSPQMVIIDDPKAFIEGTGEGGARLADEAYLTGNGIYPLQVRTVEFVAGWTRIGSAIALACALLGIFLLRKKPQTSESEASTEG